MCIVCNCGEVGDDFLAYFSAARDAMERAKKAMLICAQSAKRHDSVEPIPVARISYDRAHKKMVRLCREWNAIEAEREVGGEQYSRAAPSPCITVDDFEGVPMWGVDE